MTEFSEELILACSWGIGTQVVSLKVDCSQIISDPSPMNWHEPNSLQLIVADLNEIAADAYRHRIRPVTKKGGGGAYNASKGGFAFTLPKKYEQNRRARFAIQALSADFILIQASSPLDALSTVSATVDDRGQLKDITYPGSGPASSDVQSRPPASPRHSTRITTKVFEDL